VARKDIGLRVGFHNIHFITAVPLTLSIAVAVTKPCAADVELVGVFGAVGDHFREIKRAVLAARQGGKVHVNSELLVKQVHHDVFAVFTEEVDARRGADEFTACADVMI